MKNIFIWLTTLSFAVFLSHCDKTERDDEKPFIDLSFAGAFPKNCDTLYFDEDFVLNVIFTDNQELGSYSIDVHHNFDHHAHSTEINPCVLSDKKIPSNPFKLIVDFPIPQALNFYQTDVVLNIPLTNAKGEHDEGDYHFFMRLTDKTGWSSFRGLNIKILKR